MTLEKWGNIGSYAVSIPSNYYYTLYEVKVQVGCKSDVVDASDCFNH